MRKRIIGMSKSLDNPLKSVSNYRTELMGVAIIAVLAGHFAQLSGLSGVIVAFCRLLSLLVFTEGFLFLSGFGLFYSFSDNSSLKIFYKKRLKRLLFPYVVLSILYFVFFDLVKDADPLAFLAHISSLSFWFEGNYCGMWYIAISVALYAIFPLIYSIIIRDKNLSWGGVSGILFALWIINYILWRFTPDYYSKVMIALSQVPCFILGFVGGYYSKQEKVTLKCVVLGTVILVLISLAYFYLAKVGFEPVFFPSVAFKMITVLFCVLAFKMIDGSFIWHKLREVLLWLGKYTLELYVLHLLIYNTLEKTTGNCLLASCLMIVCAFILCKPFNNLIKSVSQKWLEMTPQNKS